MLPPCGSGGSEEFEPDADLHALPRAIRSARSQRHAKAKLHTRRVEEVNQAHASRHGRLRERSRDGGQQRRARAALVPVQRLELAGVEECVCFEGPVRLAWEVRDEARARRPEQVATERVDCGGGERKVSFSMSYVRLTGYEEGVWRTAVALPEAVCAEHPHARRPAKLKAIRQRRGGVTVAAATERV
jgi:hypothetical protein